MAEKKVPASESKDKKDNSKPVTAKNISRAAEGKDVVAGNVETTVSTTVTTVTTADLKNRFAAGSIPLSTDFNNLIDIAECGRRAVGQSADQQDNTVGLGLSLASEDDVKNKGKLAVKNYNGINVDSNGVGVKANNGINVDGNGVGVKANNGIIVDSAGVAVRAYNGIQVTGSGVAVKAKAGCGITVDESGVSIDPTCVLPRGMIMMFCSQGGTQIPTGWLLCDGNNKTPDLRNRFILGGSTTNWGDKSAAQVSGNAGALGFSITTDTGTLDLDITTESTELTIEQMPAHSHDFHFNKYGHADSSCVYYPPNADGIALVEGDEMLPISVNYCSPDYGAMTIKSCGGGQGHNHAVTTNNQTHTHKAEVCTPYYILAFIMKT